MSQQYSASQGVSSIGDSAATAEEFGTGIGGQATGAALGATESITLPQVVKGFVQQHPGKALLICVAVGLTVALLSLPGNSSTKPD